MKSLIIKSLPKEIFKRGAFAGNEGLLDNLEKAQKEKRNRDERLVTEIKGLRLFLLKL
ncbi:MAG: hypothetical protein AB1498_05950 [bacterium]